MDGRGAEAARCSEGAEAHLVTGGAAKVMGAAVLREYSHKNARTTMQAGTARVEVPWLDGMARKKPCDSNCEWHSHGLSTPQGIHVIFILIASKLITAFRISKGGECDLRHFQGHPESLGSACTTR